MTVRWSTEDADAADDDDDDEKEDRRRKRRGAETTMTDVLDAAVWTAKKL